MTEQDGILGNLPRTRPSVSSPRRAAARKAAAKKAERQGKPAADDAPSETSATPPGANPHKQSRDASGFEELARAGAGLATVTIAAGAQLAVRVLGEMAKAVGRR